VRAETRCDERTAILTAPLAALRCTEMMRLSAPRDSRLSRCDRTFSIGTSRRAARSSSMICEQEAVGEGGSRAGARHGSAGLDESRYGFG